MLVKLGLTYEPKRVEPRPEAESPPVPAEEVSSLDDAIRALEEMESGPADVIEEVPVAPVPVATPPAPVPEDAAPEDAGEAIVFWLERYARKPAEAARNLRELAAKAPDRAVDIVLPMFEAGSLGDATAFVAKLVGTQDTTVARLSRPAASLESSLCIARAVMEHEPRLDVCLAKSLLNTGHMTEAARHRGLAILEKLGSAGRLIPILIQFLRDRDSRIRSKAALMFGQIMTARGIVERLMGDTDPRVRASFVQGLWYRTGGDPRPLFRRALADSDHRVAGNALVGLHRLGETRDVVKQVGNMTRHREALFRATAAWVMGKTQDNRYVGVLSHMVRDPDPRVCRNALRALRRIDPASAAD